MERPRLKTLMIFVGISFLGTRAIHAQRVKPIIPTGHNVEVTCVALSADGKTVVSGAWTAQ